MDSPWIVGWLRTSKQDVLQTATRTATSGGCPWIIAHPLRSLAQMPVKSCIYGYRQVQSVLKKQCGSPHEAWSIKSAFVCCLWTRSQKSDALLTRCWRVTCSPCWQCRTVEQTRGQRQTGRNDLPGKCHDFRRFPPLFFLSPKRPLIQLHSTMTCFHIPYLILSYLSSSFGHFG